MLRHTLLVQKVIIGSGLFWQLYLFMFPLL